MLFFDVDFFLLVLTWNHPTSTCTLCSANCQKHYAKGNFFITKPVPCINSMHVDKTFLNLSYFQRKSSMPRESIE